MEKEGGLVQDDDISKKRHLSDDAMKKTKQRRKLL